MTGDVTQLAATLEAEERKLLACVHCGLCLEACPTYAHTGDENDGPRGRLYLMRAVEEERLAVTSPSFTRHINRCLGCRACESACPAGVEYGQLLEAARADIAAHERARGPAARLLRLALRHVWTHPARLRLAFRLARATRDARLARFVAGATMRRLLPARLVFAAALLDSSAPVALFADDTGDTNSHTSTAPSSSATASLPSATAHSSSAAAVLSSATTSSSSATADSSSVIVDSSSATASSSFVTADSSSARADLPSATEFSSFASVDSSSARTDAPSATGFSSSAAGSLSSAPADSLPAATSSPSATTSSSSVTTNSPFATPPPSPSSISSSSTPPFLSAPTSLSSSVDERDVSGGEANNVGALLFEGCVTEGLFARVNRATARVLGANGCRTEAPRGQVCCGALHAHAGELEGARALARRNIEAFGAGPALPVVTNAGGCGAMLASYAQLLAHDAEYAGRARDFSARVRDVSQQLAATGTREGADVAPDATATYDASCHLLHGQRAVTEPLRVLGAVRGLRVVPLAGSDVCCGGAGVYNLVEPELSSRVLGEKLERVRETGAHILATGNPGCHMQLGAGARLSGLALRVCHPVELLDESYRRAGLYEEE